MGATLFCSSLEELWMCVMHKWAVGETVKKNVCEIELSRGRMFVVSVSG